MAEKKHSSERVYLQLLLIVNCLLFFCAFGMPLAKGQTQLNIDATTTLSIGGVSTVDRAAYFNHLSHFNTNVPALDQLVVSETAFNSVTGRETFELDFFIAMGLEEDGDSGLFLDADLDQAIQTRFRDFILNNARWASLRDHPNPIFVQSGRAAGFWPDFMRPFEGATLPTANGGAAYAQLLNRYVEEVLLGTGSDQGFLPFDPSRHYLEIINEPQLELNQPFPGAVTWQEVIEMHQTVTESLKANFPQVQVGGASVGDNLVGPHRWSLMREMMEDMTNWSAEFDFWTIHPYECYEVTPAEQPRQITRQSPAHLNALMDLFEATSNRLFGGPKKFAVTEYGSWAFSSLGDGGGFNGSGQDFGTYTRPVRQWDFVRDIKEKLMVFLLRPDRIINATPFVQIQHFTASSPTEAEGFYNFFDRQADGSYVETIVGGLFRLYNDVQGDYVVVDSDNIDTQVVAFVDGDQIHVVLNSMQPTVNEVSINLNAGGSNVTAARLSRLFFNGTAGVYQDEIDVTSSWETVTLQPFEGAVLTLDLDAAVDRSDIMETETFYANQTELTIPANGFVGGFLIPNLTTENMQSARLRVSFSRTAAPLGEAFSVFVNGEPSIPIEATGDIGFDEDDRGMTSRLIDIPVDRLQDGNNEFFFAFGSGGGQVLAVTMEAAFQEEGCLLGDVNLDGAVNFLDLGPFLEVISGNLPFQKEADMDSSGEANFLDLGPFLDAISQ